MSVRPLQALDIAGPVVHVGRGHQLPTLLEAGDRAAGREVGPGRIDGGAVARGPGAQDDEAACLGSLAHVYFHPCSLGRHVDAHISVNAALRPANQALPQVASVWSPSLTRSTLRRYGQSRMSQISAIARCRRRRYSKALREGAALRARRARTRSCWSHCSRYDPGDPGFSPPAMATAVQQPDRAVSAPDSRTSCCSVYSAAGLPFPGDGLLLAAWMLYRTIGWTP